MLVFDLNPVFRARGIRRPFIFLKKLGLSPMVARRFVAGDTKTMKTEHIERLCLSLHCTPNDLLRWLPEKKLSVAADHPLHELRREADNLDLLSEIRDLPLEKVDELRELLKEMKTKE